MLIRSWHSRESHPRADVNADFHRLYLNSTLQPSLNLDPFCLSFLSKFNSLQEYLREGSYMLGRNRI
jgi:hypothetical protein